ncbi:Uncharacterised protein [Mycobacterium tuberculosis]|nr:Uncharacterised protein [Mycobacterium tuberculosis]
MQVRWRGLTTLNSPGRSTRRPRQCSDSLRGLIGRRKDECWRGLRRTGEHRDHPGSIVNVSGAGVDQTTNGIALAFLAIECL